MPEICWFALRFSFHHDWYMIFAYHSQFGFDPICKFTEDNIKSTKEIIVLFRKRQQIELEYAKQLCKSPLPRLA